MKLNDIRNENVQGKVVVVREDFNVPIVEGELVDTSRIDAALPTIEWLDDNGAQILLVAHLGRPEVGDFSPENSLAPVAAYLAEKMGKPVYLAESLAEFKPKNNHIVLLENVRLFEGEMDNSDELGKTLAEIGDIYVFDAFACAHRAQASTHSAIFAAEKVAAGPLLLEELAALEHAFMSPARPLVSVTGGAKVGTKVGMLSHLVDISDTIIVGGGMANTFLAAQGKNMGESLIDEGKLEKAKEILAKAQRKNVEILLPEDVVVASSMIAHQCEIVLVDEIPSDQAVFDIGPATRQKYIETIKRAGTVMWNGPLGVFEQAMFSEGTKAVGQAIAGHSGFSIAGGGDTLAAINQFELSGFDLISTGGGAFLEWLEGDMLPAIAALHEKSE